MARDSTTLSELRFRAFNSCSHSHEAWPSSSREALQTFLFPSRLIGRDTSQGKLASRLTPMFRDRDELACVSDRRSKMAEALGRSEILIVICSGPSAVSHGVDEELAACNKPGRGERNFCLAAIEVSRSPS